MRRAFITIIQGLALLLGAQGVFAQTPECDKLTGQVKSLAAEVLGREHPYACCDGTILECLRAKPVCPLALRLANNICRQAAAGHDREKIVRNLHRRAQTLLSIEFGIPKYFGLGDSPMAGDPTAKVILVEFVSARGAHCARMTPLAYRAVTEGALKGKVKLYLKHFPLRKNTHSKEAALAFMAAQRKGKFWDFVLHSYNNFDDFSLNRQFEWAQKLGITREEVEAAIQDSELKNRLVADKREGLENGVNSTPTFFIDGHHYKGELSIEELVDVLEEVHERKQ